jgi:hypothetical protein
MHTKLTAASQSGRRWRLFADLTSCMRRFDEECRVCVAEGLKGRGIQLYPDTTPTKCACAASLQAHHGMDQGPPKVGPIPTALRSGPCR